MTFSEGGHGQELGSGDDPLATSAVKANLELLRNG